MKSQYGLSYLSAYLIQSLFLLKFSILPSTFDNECAFLWKVVSEGTVSIPQTLCKLVYRDWLLSSIKNGLHNSEALLTINSIEGWVVVPIRSWRSFLNERFK